ncbi:MULTISPECIES: hypothetical protein [unclassified Shewanella]|uniref:hypothetical protein n=1 Tax=unclassified Shewanella TaxID=196818 RepID=UPI001BC30323|nr:MULTISPECIES: hypothetical protein [unclassified Shewanella]GIU20080.1 hypothetical protein TUM4444_37350 [Shewanella sp. MBTL60-112-B1]GIU34297.1 hypothetical protein TUM4445_22720 [Shewanella sp. MBTL60-112-B2]
MNFRSLCLLGMASIGLVACTQSPEWTLLYYPDSQTQPSVEQSASFINGYYETIEQCHAKGKGLIRLEGDIGGHYICGYQCQGDGQSLSCQSVIASGG